MDKLPWVEKYRPKVMDQLIGHKDIINLITRLINMNQLPHLLFYGKAGTGKTSTILACARQMYGEYFNFMVLEMNASDNRGIEIVRSEIKSFVSSTSVLDKPKLIILDEADQMTDTAQYALRKMMESYTDNARFCLICNYVQNVIPALQSRCTKIRFKPLEQSLIIDRLQNILENEKIEYDENGIKSVLNLGNGDMRKIINILQSIAYSEPKITEDSVCSYTKTLSATQYDNLYLSLKTESFHKNLELLKSFGFKDLNHIIYNISEKLINDKEFRILKRITELEYIHVESNIKMIAIVSCFYL